MEVNEKSKLSSEFLIHEFNALQSRALNLEGIKSSRVNFFLLIVAAAIAGISTVYDKMLQIGPYIFAGVLILFILGITTLKHSVDYSAAIVLLYRRAGRIRRWFININPEIGKYVAFEPNDDRPLLDISILAWCGGEAVVLLINALLLSIAATAIFYFLWHPLVYGIGIIVFAVTWFGQMFFIHWRLRKADLREQKNAYFPFKESPNLNGKADFKDDPLK